MIYFPWDPHLETGITTIDEQHKGLFSLADALQATIDTDPDDQDAITDAVYSLTDYVIQHFNDEEELMARVGYPQLGPHKALHEHLAGQTMRYTTDLFNNDEIDVGALGAFVTGWLRSHIAVEDMRYVEYARDLG